MTSLLNHGNICFLDFEEIDVFAHEVTMNLSHCHTWFVSVKKLLCHTFGRLRQYLVYELLGRIDFQWAIGRCKV